MKKNLLFLAVLLASFQFAIGQDISVNAPFVAGYNGFDWSGTVYQQGAEYAYDATYSTEGADSVELKLLILDMDHNWGLVYGEDVMSDGHDGMALDGVLDDTCMISADFPLPAELADTINPLYLFQVRVNYDPALEYDAWSNGSINLVAAFTDSIGIPADTLYPDGFEVVRGESYTFVGYYGIDDIASVEARFSLVNSSWGEITTNSEVLYEDGDVNDGHFMTTLEVPADLAEVGDGFQFFRFRALYGDGTDKMLFFWPVVVDLGISLDAETMDLQVGQTGSLMATLSNPVTEDSISWTSSDEFAVTVDENGGLAAVSEGTSTITATAIHNGATAECVVTVGPVGLEATSLNDVNVYPNPAKDEVSISGLASGTYTLEVISLLGAKQMSYEFQAESTTQVSLSEVPAGTYLIKISGEKGNYIQKISKY